MGKKRFGYYEQQFRWARQLWARSSPVRKECLLNSRVKIDGLFRYKCAMCEQYFAESDVQVDHVDPIGCNKPQDAVQYCNRFMRLESRNLQILCKPDHKLKSGTEAADRAKERHAAIVAEHMQTNVTYILHQIEDGKILKKLANVIKKMMVSEGYKHAVYEAKWHDLSKKYF